MNDDDFINADSGILNPGCHDDSCGEIDDAWERINNFNKVIKILGLTSAEISEKTSSHSRSLPTKRSSQPKQQSQTLAHLAPLPSRRPTRTRATRTSRFTTGNKGASPYGSKSRCTRRTMAARKLIH